MNLTDTHVPGTAFRRGPLAVLLTGTFLIILDFFVVNVALPSVQRDLDANSAALEWLVAGYGLTFGGLLLLASRLADRWGRRRMFMFGIGLFVVSSAACGLAPNIEILIAARLLQGAAAAAVAPTVLALIGDVYDGPHRVRALGAYATVMGLAAACGQLIGGLLIHLDLAGSGWRSIFLVNVPIGLAALVAVAVTPKLLPDTRVPASKPDAVETVLVIAALTALVLPLVEGRQQGWPLWTWVTLAASVGAGVLARRRARTLAGRGVQPLVDIEPLRARPIAAGLLALTVLFTGMASYFLVLSLYLQDGRGLSALTSGAVFTAVALPYMLGTRNAARALGRFGARGAITAAALTFCAGHALLLVAVEEIGVDGSVFWLIPGLALGGFGMGIALSGLVGVTMGSVQPRYAGTVSATSSTLQQMANAVGVALIGIVYFRLLSHGVAVAFEASLIYLIVTTATVAVAAGRGRFASGRNQPRLTTPEHRSPVATLRALRVIRSVPARFAVDRSTENEPLGALVTD
jgi:EmrB/QacA subfamily drug resistance transporter